MAVEAALAFEHKIGKVASDFLGLWHLLLRIARAYESRVPVHIGVEPNRIQVCLTPVHMPRQSVGIFFIFFIFFIFIVLLKCVSHLTTATMRLQAIH